MKRVIGGEFEIENLRRGFVKIPDIFSKGYFYSSGRAALYHILMCVQSCGTKKVLLPDYLCESVIHVVRLASIPYDFYSLNSDLSINTKTIHEVYDKDTTILIVNYFGGLNIHREIEKVKGISNEGFIILDNVQSLFSMFESVDVDFMFTSFRKQLPVPDGAWAISKSHSLKEFYNKNSYAQYKLAGGYLKQNCQLDSIDESVYLDLFCKGESLIDSNINSCMSDITVNLLQGIDLDAIRERRLENSRFLIEGLRELGISPILDFSNDKVPLFVPVLFKNRNFIRSLLSENRIYCPVHWPKFTEIGLRENPIYDEELSLIIDQRYSIEDIKLLLSVIESGMKNGM